MITGLSGVQFLIIRVIPKSDDHAAGVRFAYHRRRPRCRCLIGTLRSRAGMRTTARQRTVRTGPRFPSHAIDKSA